MKWTAIIVALWVALVGSASVQKYLPVQMWFDVAGVTVESGSDACLLMSVDREILAPFHADWTVTIMRRNSTGGFYTFRTYRGSNDYEPGAELPADIDLCWWTWSESIDLPPGQYRVRTLWRLDLGNAGQRQVRRTSNVFTVTQASR